MCQIRSAGYAARVPPLMPFLMGQRGLASVAMVGALIAAAVPLVGDGSSAEAAMSASAASAARLAPPHASDRVIVGYKAGASRVKRQAATRTVGPASVSAISPLSTDAVIVELAPGQTVAAAIDEIGQQPGIAFVEPDYRVQPAATSDDPYYTGGTHWGMYGDSTTPHANSYGSGAGEAWADGHTGSSDVVVGIIDEGIDITHPDLVANVWSNPWETANGLDDDGNGYVDDLHGWDFYNDDASVFDGSGDDHGTHVAGTVGARGGNGVGVAGVNWRVTLVSAKFLGSKGGFTSDAIRALDYVTDLKTRHSLDIVATNNSWSGGGYSQGLLNAIDRAGDADILFVAAAGNGGRDIDAVPEYPGAYRCVTRANGSPRGWDCLISVANLTSGGGREGTSNWGAAAVDLGAPGTAIVSTIPAGSATYAYYTGTSMAAPHVTGAAALCASLDPSLSARQIRDLILTTGAPTASMVGTTATGDRLDIGAMARQCAPPTPPPPTPSPSPPPTPTPTPSPSASPSPSPTPEPTAPVVGATVYVDDLSALFRRTGTDWREAAAGYAEHHFWVPTRSDSVRHSGAWKPLLSEAGYYEISVKLPAQNATSRKATYRISTADGWVTRVRSQAKRAGEWVSLGTHRLTTTPIVKLVDATGEAESLQRRLAYDAARFEPTSQPADRTHSPAKERSAPTTNQPEGRHPGRGGVQPSDEPSGPAPEPAETAKPASVVDTSTGATEDPVAGRSPAPQGGLEAPA